MDKKHIYRYVYVCPRCFRRPRNCFCRACPETLIQIDKNILPTIQVLNEKGFVTECSCEGHIGESGALFILFCLTYQFSHPLPDGFIGDGSTILSNISGNSEQEKRRDKREKLARLYSWASSLRPQQRTHDYSQFYD